MAGGRSSSRLGNVLASATTLPISYGFVLCLQRHPSYLSSALWGIVILLAAYGFGRVGGILLECRRKSNIGLDFALGFSIILVLGGVLCLFGIATAPVLSFVVVSGLTSLVLTLPPPSLAILRSLFHNRIQNVSALRVVAIFSFIVLLLAQYTAALFDDVYQSADDPPAYFAFAQEILSTGTLMEPFSFRRVASYGGQSFLHAILMVVAPVQTLNLLDKGVCIIGTIFVLAGYMRNVEQRWVLLNALLLIVLLFPIRVLNTSSIYSGVFIFTSLWATLTYVRTGGGTPIRSGLMVALPAAAAMTLRSSYIPAAITLIACAYLPALQSRQTRRPALLELAVCSLALLVFVLPWSVLLLKSSGTPLYPAVQGYVNPQWTALSAYSSADFIASLQVIFHTRTFLILACLYILAFIVLLPDSETRPLKTLLGGTIIVFLTHAWAFAHVQPNDLLRYTLGFVLPPLLYATISAYVGLARCGVVRAPRWRAAASLVFAVVWMMACLPSWRTLTGKLERFASAVWSIDQRPVADGLRAGRYRMLQTTAPPDARIVAMLDDAYLLDFKRNDIALLDIPCAVSPPPGLQTADSPQKVVTYFQNHGFYWMALSHTEKAQGLYSQNRWAEHAGGVRLSWHYREADVRAWILMGKTVTGFLNQLPGIVSSCRVARDDGWSLLIDLSTCRFPAGNGDS